MRPGKHVGTTRARRALSLDGRRSRPGACAGCVNISREEFEEADAGALAGAAADQRPDAGAGESITSWFTGTAACSGFDNL